MNKLMTVTNLVEIFGVKRMTIYKWIWAGRLPARKMPGSNLLYVSDADLKTFYERGTLAKKNS